MNAAEIRRAVVDMEDVMLKVRDGSRAVYAIGSSDSLDCDSVIWVAIVLMEQRDALHEQWRALDGQGGGPAMRTASPIRHAVVEMKDAVNAVGHGAEAFVLISASAHAMDHGSVA